MRPLGPAAMPLPAVPQPRPLLSSRVPVADVKRLDRTSRCRSRSRPVEDRHRAYSGRFAYGIGSRSVTSRASTATPILPEPGSLADVLVPEIGGTSDEVDHEIEAVGPVEHLDGHAPLGEVLLRSPKGPVLADEHVGNAVEQDGT